MDLKQARKRISYGQTALEFILKDSEEKEIEKEMYENCIADLVGELQNFSYSCYFRSANENELINFFKNKWGIKL
jgi:outer membrane lipopolysaccharide assembly protein LptE/RlpB